MKILRGRLGGSPVEVDATATRWSQAPSVDAWEDYRIRVHEPSADDLLAAHGWGGEAVASYDSTDQEPALAVCRSVSSDEMAAGLLYRFCEIEAAALVAREPFGVAGHAPAVALEDQGRMALAWASVLVT